MPSVSISVRLNLPARLFAPAAPDVSRAFGEVFAKRGYIVLGTQPGPSFKIGERVKNIWGYPTRRVFVVTEFTTKKDCEEQLDLMAKSNKNWHRRPMCYPSGTTFYRVVPLALARKQKLLKSSDTSLLNRIKKSTTEELSRISNRGRRTSL